MKFELTYTDDYVLMEFDSIYIGIGEYIYHKNSNRIIRKETTWQGGGFRRQILAHLPLRMGTYLEGLFVLPDFPPTKRDTDVNALIIRETEGFLMSSTEITAYGLGCLNGYDEAKKTYKYTDEDLIAFAAYCIGYRLKHPDASKSDAEFLTEFITNRFPERYKYFDCEIEITEFGAEDSYYIMELDEYIKPKTTIRGDGVKELVGTFTNQ